MKSPSLEPVTSEGGKVETLRLLDQMISSHKLRSRTEGEFLRPPTVPQRDWFIWVPAQFNSALDIAETARITEKGKKSVWTQGSRFAFAAGDILHDRSEAYETWGKALLKIKRSFRVEMAIPAEPRHRPGKDQPVVPRSAGYVKFSELVPSDDRTRLVVAHTHSMTQDEFVRVLIVGFPASGELPLTF